MSYEFYPAYADPTEITSAFTAHKTFVRVTPRGIATFEYVRVLIDRFALYHVDTENGDKRFAVVEKGKIVGMFKTLGEAIEVALYRAEEYAASVAAA